MPPPASPIILSYKGGLFRNIFDGIASALQVSCIHQYSSPFSPLNNNRYFSSHVSSASSNPIHPSVPRFIIRLLSPPSQRPFIIPHPLATPTKVFISVGIPLYFRHQCGAVCWLAILHSKCTDLAGAWHARASNRPTAVFMHGTARLIYVHCSHFCSSWNQEQCMNIKIKRDLQLSVAVWNRTRV